jgi:aquaporin Z
MFQALRDHWPEYLMEAAGLGLFMISACVFTVLLMHPASPVGHWIAHPLLKRAVIGMAMGLTAVALIYSPWGQQSGAHLNPSVTLSFFWLGKITGWDAVFYVVSQFIGAATGVFVCAVALTPWISHPRVNYAVTVPGSHGVPVAFLSEFVISLLLMATVLVASNSKKLPTFTGVFSGLLVAAYIMVEAPFSGMSMNPARTFGSALSAGVWRDWWIYFTAPPIGMLVAADIYERLVGSHSVLCAKLHHGVRKRCIFNCGYRAREFKRMLEVIRDTQAGIVVRMPAASELAGRIPGTGEGTS